MLSFNEKLVRFMCSTSQPFSIVDNPQFRDLFDPSVNIPCRQTIATSGVDETFVNILHQIFSKYYGLHFAATTDGWAKFLQHYWSLTISAIDKDWNMHSDALFCLPILPSHLDSSGATSSRPKESAAAIAKALLEALRRVNFIDTLLEALNTDAGGAAPNIAHELSIDSDKEGDFENHMCLSPTPNDPSERG